jgi:hypothetical protein
MLSGMSQAPIDGHSPEVVHELIRFYSASMPHQNAVNCALRDARRAWRAENPRGAFPAHLVKKKKKRKNKYVEEIV